VVARALCVIVVLGLKWFGIWVVFDAQGLWMLRVVEGERT
jgi:hypothetical protein